MSEDIARIVASEGAETVQIGGKTCTTRALSLRELGEIERECLNLYRRSYLESYSQNGDLLPVNLKEKLMIEKFEESARWDVSDLPLKEVYDPARLVVNDSLIEHLAVIFDFTSGQFDKLDEKTKKKQYQRLTATALEQGELSEDDYTRMTKNKPRKAKAGYVQWWITATYEGMLTMVWAAFKHNGVTKDEVSATLGKDLTMLVNLSREIEKLSAPSSGNT